MSFLQSEKLTSHLWPFVIENTDFSSWHLARGPIEGPTHNWREFSAPKRLLASRLRCGRGGARIASAPCAGNTRSQKGAKTLILQGFLQSCTTKRKHQEASSSALHPGYALEPPPA